MNENQSYERLIKRKSEGKILLFKILLIAGYFLFAIVCSALIVFLADANIYLFILAAILDACFYFFTWKLVNVEYEYAFIGGSFYLSKIYGKSFRKELFESDLSLATAVAPYEGQYKKDIQNKDISKEFKAISSVKARDIWFMLFEKENGDRTVIIFEADERSLKLIRQGCPRAVAREKLTSQNPNNDNL